MNIKAVVDKTIGGLPPGQYVRHFLFGLMFPAFLLWVNNRAGYHSDKQEIGFFVLAVLYPYSRHAYETVVGYLMGNNTVLVPIWLLVFWKILTMAVCWGAAVVIAPVGWIILYYQNNKAIQQQNNIIGGL